MNDILIQKHTRFFYEFDIDQNGVLEWNDFQQLVDNLAAWRELDAAQPSYQQLLKLFQTYWRRIVTGLGKQP